MRFFFDTFYIHQVSSQLVMLSNKTIEQLVLNGCIFDSASVKGLSKNQIKSASIDLSIGYIFQSDENKTFDNEQDLILGRKTACDLLPGETALIQVKEYFNFSNDIAGTLFPPNRMSKSGLIMTNPGHIDPGYKGLITVCLVNVGKRPVTLIKGHTIARLILQKTDELTIGFQGPPGRGVDVVQINSVTKDFMGVDSRIYNGVSTYVKNNIALIITSIGLILTIFAVFMPELSRYRVSITEQEIRDKLASEARLEKKLNQMNDVIMLLCQESKSKTCSDLSDSTSK